MATPPLAAVPARRAGGLRLLPVFLMICSCFIATPSPFIVPVHAQGEHVLSQAQCNCRCGCRCGCFANTHTHSCTCTNAHAHMHTCTQTRTQTRKHARTHAHARLLACGRARELLGAACRPRVSHREGRKSRVSRCRQHMHCARWGSGECSIDA